MKRKYIVLTFVLLLLGVLLLSFWKKAGETIHKVVDKNCHFDSAYITDVASGCEYTLVSYSDSNRFSKSGIQMISGSKWVNGDRVDLLSGSNIKLSFLFQNFFDASLVNKTVIAYDEVGGAKAGLVVFLAREYGIKDVYLWGGTKLNKSFYVDANLTGESFSGALDFWSGSFAKDFPAGYIGSSKFRVVYDPTQLNLEKDDLLVYISDEGTMKLDNFYKNNNTKINIKNLYWSFLLEFDGNLKNKEGIQSELDKSSLDLKKYKNIYFYYPVERHKSGLAALIFNQYFSN